MHKYVDMKENGLRCLCKIYVLAHICPLGINCINIVGKYNTSTQRMEYTKQKYVTYLNAKKDHFMHVVHE